MADPMVHLTLSQLEAVYKAGNQKAPSSFEKILLHSVKIPGDQVRTFARMFELAQSVMGAISMVGAAVSTVKTLLELTGLLKTVDPFAEVKQLFEARFQELKDFLQDEEQEEQIDLRIGWQLKVQQARIALSNLQARSEITLGNANDALIDLAAAITDMLQPAAVDTGNGLSEQLPARGWITYAWGAYSYPPQTYTSPPDHWIAYARPEFMALAGSPAPVQFSNQADNLKQRIWDPGFYLDVLIEALSTYVSLLGAVEPAFRATRYERDRLRHISSLLAFFIQSWKARIIRTKVPPFLPPAFNGDQTHPYHPYHNPYFPTQERGIPLGVIDPVSGIAAFDPVFAEGFDFADGLFSPDPRLIKNATEARTIAETRLQELIDDMPAVCGISALEVTKRRFDELADYGLYGSAFCKFEPMPLKNASSELELGTMDLTWPMLRVGEEQVLLGDLGAKAGKPLKIYKAVRYNNINSYSYRGSMARRMDVTKIQLGYRLTVSDEAGTLLNIPLCPHHGPGTAFETDLTAFPAFDEVHDFASEDAWVYDVMQSSLTSVADDIQKEQGHPIPGFQRLFINRRKGAINAKIRVWSSFDGTGGDAVLGHVNFVVSNADETPDGAFHLSFSLYETASIAYGSYHPAFATDEVREIIGASMGLHVIPTFLVVEPDYFTDRMAGLAVIDKSILDVVQTLDMVPKPWEDDFQPPVWRLQDPVYLQERALERHRRLARDFPAVVDLADVMNVPRQATDR